jgi:hypothetical protein
MAKKSQIQKFREAAKAAETHDSEKRFNAALKAVAKSGREPRADNGKTAGERASKKQER